ncbi:ribosome silencing factor [Aquisalibacillus elongatus]|uniref:Ribosomal silencing factor RsfS n=1 Tax=Aquisalibacillus elongatus TaxID=485577 RepID=A0A3N5CAC3_9BACI|nr:ribosome silencing factor [Aquisalibacillus elongatus]RPF55565.1 ribosome-associated protein [Aquisalibacillus elongatus]
MDSQQLLQIAAQACDDKRAENIVALDMRDVSLIADYFLICHGSNERQVDAISKGIQDAVEEEGFTVRKIEGRDQARWVLVDLEHVVVHIFHKEERDYYNLEKLWGDADRVQLDV